MAKLQKFIPFVKVDSAKREVWGVVTAEVEDKDGETCHYDSTVPHYKSLVDEMSKATDGKNIFPLREMHQLSAVGKGVGIEFRDEAKEIFMGFKVVDDVAWKKVDEGVYTGFSQGGSYAKQWSEKGVKYYTADPSECSLVDNPCLGVAHFAYVKADGSVEMRKLKSSSPETQSDVQKSIEKLEAEIALLKAEKKTKRVAGEDLPSSAFAYVGDSEDTSTWKLPIKFSDEEKTKSHIRNALARFNQTKGIPADEKDKVHARIAAAAKKHGIDVAEESKKVDQIKADFMADIEKRATAKKLDKSMYSVGRLADVLQSLCYLRVDLEYERDIEGDDSEVPDDLQENLENLIETFLALAEEEASELAAYNRAGNKGGMYMSAKLDDLVKATKTSLASHFKKAAAHHEAKAAHHESMAKAHNDMMEHHAAAMGKADGDGFHKAAHAFHKAAAGHHEKAAKAHGGYAEHLHKMSEACSDMDGKTVADFEMKKADDPKPGATGEPNVEADVQKMITETFNKTVAESLARIQNSDDIKQMVDKAVAARIAESLGSKVEPTTIKTAGPQLISRDGKTLEKSAVAVNDLSDTGL